MYAPTFPYYGSTKRLWHKVNPLDTARPFCNGKTVVDCNEVREQLPEGACYCQNCNRMGYPRPQS